MVNFIKAISHNTSLAKDRSDDFDRLAHQISTINETRDMLLHNFHEQIPGTWRQVQLNELQAIVGNAERVSRIGKEREYVFSNSDIENICNDLRTIQR